MKTIFCTSADGKFIMNDGKLVCQTLDITVIPGGSAAGVTVTHYSTSEETTLKNELISAGTYTSAELENAYIININGTTPGTVILDVSALGNVGDYIKLVHKKSNNTWETLYEDTIPSNKQVEITLTEFSPIVGSKVTRYYNITTSLSNVVGTSSNPTQIAENGTATLTFTANTGYELPDSIIIYNANYTWTKSSGTLILNNPEGDVTVGISGKSADGYSLTVSVGGDTTGSFSLINKNGETVSWSGESLSTTYNNILQITSCGCGERGYFTVNGSYVSLPYTLTGDSRLSITTHKCFVEGTKIALANGNYKYVEDINYDDNILVWNMYEAKLDSAKPYWIQNELVSPYYYELTFSDNSKLKLVGPGEKMHRLFSIEKQEFLYANEIIGDHVYCQDGSIKQLTNIEKIEKEVKYYNFKTENYLNCFAEGILTGHTFNNLYQIKDMQYINLENPKYTQEEIDILEREHNTNTLTGYKGNFQIKI